jgi:predicted RND superfamily exporter protein
MEHVSESMRSTGRAVIFTTLALIGGFLSMLSNELLAIRDMGLVAAVTFLGAMLADLLLLPAVYVALGDKQTGTNETAQVSGV